MTGATRRQPNPKHVNNPREAWMRKRIELAKYVHEQVDIWIENADTKVGVSCGLFLGAFGVVSFLSEHYAPTSDPNVQVKINECWSIAHGVFMVGGLVFMGAALLLYALSITPNLKSSATCERKKSFLLFYGDIAKVSIEEFTKSMIKARERDFLHEIINETYHNAGICHKKMKLYRVAVWFSVAAILLALCSWVARMLMYV